ncbi:nucleolar transcription factor 1-like isoform X2 [Sparus aurata]|uniref:nucleolar transcription factor 1-like isoform X2 n=1 Tax=Sparus aurata TaxID=8175 RepID=UPI0011C18B65|nr:nucleolar transcription factor 1-like isoform X2 [Sparus aurata]
MSGNSGSVRVTEPEESDESTDLDESIPIDESTGWTKENLQKLLAAMKTSYPEEYGDIAYPTGLKAVDWEKVAFPPFSPEACQNKWRKIFHEMRKLRTLAELIDEAEESITNLVLNKKARYVDRLASEEHKRQMKVFRKQHPVLVQQKKSTPQKRKRVSAVTPNGEQPKDAAGLPPKPPCNGYSIFCQEQLPTMAGISSRTYMSVWAERWKGLTKREKDAYSIQHTKLQRKYMKALNEYVKSFSEEEKQRLLNEHGIKVAMVNKRSPLTKRLPGEPKMPSRSGNVIFCQDQMELMREELPNARERFRKVNQMWKELSNEEKFQYKEKVNKKLKKYSKKLQKWLKTLTQEDQDNYWERNPTKRQYLNPNSLKRKSSKSEIVYRPSDSEDEEIEVSNRDEPKNNLEEEEEEEEDEDDKEDVVMFDIY